MRTTVEVVNIFNMEKTLEEYNRIQAIRKWNAGFRTPPVPTTKWNEKDWEKWRESQKPLPPFEEWKEQ